MKALGMLSGGLDSQLAMKLMLNQGIEMVAFHYRAEFCTGVSKGQTENVAVRAARKLGIPIHVIDITLPMLEVIKKPKHGHGSAINPCIDCRIYTFTQAKKYMAEIGASFLVTGEVLNSRPMSQRPQTLGVIERQSGLEGYIVRPLSAKALAPSIPEQKGWVDREKLLAIDGRSRKIQIALAQELGIVDYPTPAGGCLLAEKEYEVKLTQLLEENPFPEIRDVELLRTGRHIIAQDGTRYIIPRNQVEDEQLSAIIRPTDLVLRLKDILGPSCLIVNPNAGDETIKEAATNLVRYSKARDQKKVTVIINRSGVLSEIEI